MSGRAFSTMNEPDLLLASFNSETYLSEADVRRLLAELRSRHDSGGDYSKAIRRVKRSLDLAGDGMGKALERVRLRQEGRE